MEVRTFVVVDKFAGGGEIVRDLCSGVGRLLFSTTVRFESGRVVLFLVFRGCVAVERLYEAVRDYVVDSDSIRASSAKVLERGVDSLLVCDCPQCTAAEIPKAALLLANEVSVDAISELYLFCTPRADALERLYHFFVLLGCCVVKHGSEKYLPIVRVRGIRGELKSDELVDMFSKVVPPLCVKKVELQSEALAVFSEGTDIPALCTKLGKLAGSYVFLSQYLLQRQEMKIAQHQMLVAGLPENAQLQQLRQIFEPYGHVYQYKQLDGEQQGRWVVEYLESESALAAETELNGAVVDGKTLNASVLRRVVVRNLPPKFTEENVRKIFSKCASVEFKTSRRTKKSYVILSFTNDADAHECIKLGNQTICSGVSLKCCLESELHNYDNTDSASIVGKRNTVVFHNLPPNMVSRNEHVVELCRQFGIVEQVIIPQPSTHDGLAFVVFRDQGAAQRAVDSLMNAVIGEKTISVEMYNTSNIGPATTNIIRERAPAPLEVAIDVTKQERKGLNIFV